MAKQMDWFLKGGYTTYSALCCSSRFGRAIVTRLGQYRIVTDALEKCALERAFDSDSLTAAHHSAESSRRSGDDSLNACTLADLGPSEHYIIVI